MKKKLSEQQGFTLVELLAATLVMLMVTIIVAGGIPVAREAYNKITLEANSQVMLETAAVQLRNELGNAVVKKPSNDTSDTSDTSIEYYNRLTKSRSRIEIAGSDDDEYTGLIIKYLGYEGVETDPDAHTTTIPLVAPLSSTRKTTNKDLYVTCEKISVEPDNKTVTFQKLNVIKKEGSDTEYLFKPAEGSSRLKHNNAPDFVVRIADWE